MINVAQRWIKQDRDQSKKIKIEIKVKTTTGKTDRREWALLDWSNNVIKAEVYNISSGQYQSLSGLLGKTRNIQNIYYCKIINGSYSVWRGKVWLLVILLMLSTWFNGAFVIFNILGNLNAASRTVLMNIDALYLTPPVVTSKPQFQNTFSEIATLFPICCLSPVLKHLDMNAIVLGKQVRRTSLIKHKIIEPLGMNKRDEF